MCGRFALDKTAQQVAEYFQVKCNASYQGDSNISPNQDVLVMAVNALGEKVIERMYWGFIPSWLKGSDKPLHQLSQINARAETISAKPYFRDSFAKRRCIIPAAGFYEWSAQSTKEVKKPKQIWHIQPDSGLFSFAGIWDFWRNKDQSLFISCAIVTRPAYATIKDIHHRAPVILSNDGAEKWLNKSTDPSYLQGLALAEGKETSNKIICSKIEKIV